MSARSASAPWPISRRLGRTHAAGLTGAVGREVVVVHVALARHRGDSVSSCCSIFSMLSVVTPRIWVSPRSNRAEPCTRGSDLDLGAQGADVGEATAVDADVVAQDALADQLLGAPSGTPPRPPSRGPRTGRSSWRLDGGLDLVEARSRAPACRRSCSAAARSRLGGLSTAAIHVVLVVEEDGEVLDRLGRRGGELGLGVAELADERLGGLQALRDDLLGRRLLALVRDEVPGRRRSPRPRPS